MAYTVPSAFRPTFNECYVLPFADPFTAGEYINPSPSNPPVGPISGISVTNITTTGFTVSCNLVSFATNYSFHWGTYIIGSLTPSATFTNLPPETTNSLIIYAYNEDGTVLSTPQNVSTLLPPPSKPAGIFITNLTSSGFTANWEASSYAVSYSAVWGTTNATSIVGTTAIFTGLPSQITKNVVITATNPSGNTASDPFPVTLPSGPAKPTGFAIRIQGTSYYKVSWTNDPSVTYTATVDSNPVTVFTDEANPYIQPTGLSSGTSYTLIVTATDALGSTASDPFSTSTLSPRTISQSGIAANPPYPSAPFNSKIANFTIPSDFDITNNSDTSNPEWVTIVNSLLGTDPLNPSGDEIVVYLVSVRFSENVNEFRTTSVNGDNLIIIPGYTTYNSWSSYVDAGEEFEIWLSLDGTISLLDTTSVQYSFTYNPVVFDP